MYHYKLDQVTIRVSLLWLFSLYKIFNIIFSLPELLQHLVEPGRDVLQFGRLKIHGIDREVVLGERRVDLIEAFDLFEALGADPGREVQELMKKFNAAA